jgi:RNA polymerase sigma factor (sigma-70 family)
MPRAREALSRLCQAYWYPLYSFARRRGHSAEDAQDLTQEFLARLLEKNWIGDADRDKGRFRTFLLTAMKHFLSDEWDKARARKRGGGVTLQPLQFGQAESRYNLEPLVDETPERIFEVRWAMALLEQVLNRLRTEYEKEGKAGLFAALHPCLIGERTSQPYAELAKSLGASESMVKSAVHRLRQRYRQLLRDEIAHTIAVPDEVDEEMRYLFSILSY